MWVSAMFMEEFWERIIPKYGITAFRMPKVFRSERLDRRSWKRLFRLKPVSIDSEPGVWKPHLESTIKRFKETEEAYEKIRPWAQAEYDRWQRTPWSHAKVRVHIMEYSEAHARRDFREATDAARRIIGFIADARILDNNWDDDAASQGLPNPVRGDLKEAPTYAMLHVLAYMMQAALPNHYLACEKRDVYGITHDPTRGAQAAHPTHSAATHRNEYPEELPSEESRTITDNYTGYDASENNPLENLEEGLETLLAYEARGVPIAKPWRDSIIDLHGELRQQFRENDEDYSIWVDFNFIIPAFQPNDLWGTVVRPGAGARSYASMRFEPQGDIDLSFTKHFLPSPPGHLPGDSATKKAMDDASLGLMADAPNPVFTIAAAADKGWIAEAGEGGTTDVYDIRGTLVAVRHEIISGHLGLTTTIGLLKRQEFSGVGVDDVTTCGENGRQLLSGDVSRVASSIRRVMKDTLEPEGKLLQWIRPEEIVEHDGKNGMSNFVTFGGEVYNVTGAYLRSHG